MNYLMALIGFLGLACSYAGGEKQLIVAVIDTGLDITDRRFEGKLCNFGHKDFTGEGLHDYMGHGTHVAGIIANTANVPGYCMVIVKIFAEKQTEAQAYVASAKAIGYATQIGASVVNISGGGPGYSGYERRVIAWHPNTIFVVAAGNDGVKSYTRKDYAYYPAYYGLRYGLQNVLVVGAADRNGKQAKFSNYGNFWEVGVNVLSYSNHGGNVLESGTSQATAKKTGHVISAMLGFNGRP